MFTNIDLLCVKLKIDLKQTCRLLQSALRLTLSIPAIEIFGFKIYLSRFYLLPLALDKGLKFWGVSSGIIKTCVGSTTKFVEFLNFFFPFLRQCLRSRTHDIVQAGLKFSIFLPQSPECWYCRCKPPCLTVNILFESMGKKEKS
jgi:hypothetical protein